MPDKALITPLKIIHCWPFQLQASHLSLEDPTSAPDATRRCISVSKSVSSYLSTCMYMSVGMCLSHCGCYSDHLHGAAVCVCLCVCVCAAEKVSSLGKNWHRPCLRCERCSKTLAPGSHAEVRDTGGRCATLILNSTQSTSYHIKK